METILLPKSSSSSDENLMKKIPPQVSDLLMLKVDGQTHDVSDDKDVLISSDERKIKNKLLCLPGKLYDLGF